uniref:Nudix hydrolase domain-containing protein n=1 Tax=Lygus hesperus TaxID=30085 RepID=A0A0A9WYM3_LYGHE
MYKMNGEGSLVSRLLKLAQQFNSFYLNGLENGDYRPFIVSGEQVGLISPDVAKALSTYPDVFVVNPSSVSLNPAFRDYNERSQRIEEVLMEWRQRGRFVALKGWRDECYEIKRLFSSEPLLKMDRSATCLFGICKYGVTITGFVKDQKTGGLNVWLQKRSQTKQTWPGKWDNMVAGGLSVGYGVLETAYKEAEEEANIPPHLLRNLVSRGCVSFYYESEKGIFPNTEFVYDLELPPDFIPTNNDGEVETFELLPAKDLIDRLFMPEFKTTSCPVVVDFLIRHGIVNPDSDPQFPLLVELLHVPLQSLYKPRAKGIPFKNGNSQPHNSES